MDELNGNTNLCFIPPISTQNLSAPENQRHNDNNQMFVDETNPTLEIDRCACDSIRSVVQEQEVHRRRRERKKQLNRESARRSRIRRLQECEEIQAAVQNLSEEGSMLTEELRRLSEECVNLLQENNSIMDELEKIRGPDAISDLKAVQSGSTVGESRSK